MACNLLKPTAGADTYYSFGLRECVVAPYVEDPTQAQWVEAYGIQSLSLSPEVIGEELLGNDVIQELAGYLKSINFSIEQGKISMEAYGIMTGGDYTPSQVGPPVVSASLEIGQGCFFPYFMLKAQSLDTNGGALVIQMNKCMLTDFFEMNFEQENFMNLSAGGRAIGDANGLVISFTDTIPATLLTT